MKQKSLQKRWVLALSFIFHAVLLIIVYVLQSMIFPYMRFYGLVPLLLPIVSTGVAVYQGRVTGGTVGIFAGILCDVAFNRPVGAYTVLLTMTGLLIGFLSDTVMARGFATYMMSCATVLIITAFAQMFPLLFFENVPSAPLISLAVRQTLYSLVYACPLWFFVRSLGDRNYANER